MKLTNIIEKRSKKLKQFHIYKSNIFKFKISSKNPLGPGEPSGEFY